MLNAYVTASNAGSDDTTELAKYTMGSALQFLSKGLAGDKAKRLHSQGTPKERLAAGYVGRVTSVAPAPAPTSVA